MKVNMQDIRKECLSKLGICHNCPFLRYPFISQEKLDQMVDPDTCRKYIFEKIKIEGLKYILKDLLLDD
jgi:hypothetical protein